MAKTDEFKSLLRDITKINVNIPDGINGKRIEKINKTDNVQEKMDKLSVQTGEIIH